MFWRATILTATILTFFGGGVKAQGSSGSSSNYTDLTLQPDGIWKVFNFGQVGIPPFVMLHFTIGLMEGSEDNIRKINSVDVVAGDSNTNIKKCYLEVTDAFCPGDRFELIKLGTGGLAPVTILETPAVPFNNQTSIDICDGFPVQCSNCTSNPDITFNDPIWSSGSVLVEAGSYSVVLKSILSPYCSGAGFVRVRCTSEPQPPNPPLPPPHPDTICPYSEGGFKMVMTPVQGPMAGSICQSIGLKLAEIDNSNFVPSTNVAFKCSGPLSTSWIGAWNGQTWAGQEGLGLTVSTASPGGSINVYNDGQARNVLCQEM